MKSNKTVFFSLIRPLRRIQTSLMALVLAGAAFCWPTKALAADHRESPTADANAEGDITDVFGFLDPNDPTQLVLIMDVSPFSVPDEPNYSFSTSILYQFKIALTQNAVEDLVIQATFTNVPATTCASGQMVNIYGPSAPNTTGVLNTVMNQSPTVSGCTGATIQQNSMQVFAGLRDDPFVTDVGQLMRILQSKQDLFRNFPGFALGALRGRTVRADNTTGVDGFGGFNVESIAIELPKSAFAGFLGSVGLIGVWGTTSLPVTGGSTSIASAGHEHLTPVVPSTYMQFQRVGQQLFKTVFVPAATREAFNASTPANDVQNWASLIPGTLTTKDNDGTGNTIAGRAALLTALGFTDAGTVAAGAGHGAPLLLPGTFANTNPNLLQVALLPDVMRINLSLIPSGILPGAAAAGGNADPQLALGAFGLQNGRRPADTVTDILLSLARQLADVNFPASTGVAGSGPARANALSFATDRRVLAVLQGTDWIKPDSQVGNVSGNVAPFGGNDQPLLTTFPFLAAPAPLPGETGTVGFPAQQ
jgi:hypothetical protein